jgi:hypothetical protein
MTFIVITQSEAKGLLVQTVPTGGHTVLAQTALNMTPGTKTIADLQLANNTGDANQNVVFLGYDTHPKHGTFPKDAKLLSYGKLTNIQVSGPSNDRFVVYLGGVVAHLTQVPDALSFPGDGRHHKTALPVHPTDYGNNPIVADTKDPYANPIRVAVVENGGTGHTRLSLNGSGGERAIVLMHSTDTIEVEYDGWRRRSYSAKLMLMAPPVQRTAGARATIPIDVTKP